MKIDMQNNKGTLYFTTETALNALLWKLEENAKMSVKQVHL